MKKIIKEFWILAILLSVALSGYAYDFSVDGIYYSKYSDGKTAFVTYKDTSFNSYSGSVVIPSTVTYSGTTYSVTNIGDDAFYYCRKLTSVTIPNSVTSIGNDAFENCSGLKTVIIPNSVTSIGKFAFNYCIGLTSVTIGNSVTSIGNCAFDNCSGLKQLTIQDGTSTLSLGYNSKSSSSSSVGEGLFYDSPLERVYLGRDLSYDTSKSCGYSPFYGKSTIKELTIGNSVTSIVEWAFYKCSGLTSVTIPNSVNSIGESAFSSCSSLKTVVFGSGLKEIGCNAFYNCSLVKTFWLPNTPPSGTINVKSSVYYVANDQYSFSNQIKYQFLSSMFAVDGTVYVPVSPSERTCDVINCTYSPDDKSIVIKNKVINKGVELSVLKINPYSHIGNPFIENLSISYNGPIGDSAFENCNALKSASVENCGSIGDYAFHNCDALISATIKNCGPIGHHAFQNCDVLKSATVENCGSIGDYAFQNCDVLESATVDNCGSVGDYAFQNCDALKLAIIKNCGPIGDSAFENCYALKSATVENCGSIGDYAFQNCDVLESATVENNGLIGNYAFSGCTSLITVTLGSSVTGIGDKAFYNCSSLDKIIIPDAVTTVGTSAFEGCVSLEIASIGKDVLSLSQSVFSGCRSLSSLTIPKNVKSIGNYAFSGCISLSDITIEDGEGYESSNENTVLNIGSNGSSPLFNDCPLDEVYIGRKLSYTTNSSAGYSPFYRNTSLRRVRITDAETQIYDNEFYGCSNLQALTIGNGVTTIGKWAFSGCSAMKDFSVGSKVESIGQEAFSDCTGLTSFYSYSIVPPTCGNQALDDINKWECSLYVPDDCISAYQAADQWKEFFFIYGGEEEMSIEDKSAPNIVSGVLRCDGVFTDVYTLFGVKVYSGNGEVKLEGGVYIVVANGHATKVMVK